MTKETRESEQANIYRHGGVWAYALFIDGEYDHSDTLAAEVESDARAEIQHLFPAADIVRVSDVAGFVVSRTIGKLDVAR